MNMWTLKLKIQYYLHSSKMKHLDINLMKQVKNSYAENHTTSMKEIKKGLNKWRDIPGPLMVILKIVMSICSKFIQV